MSDSRVLGAIHALEYKAGEANLEIGQLVAVDTDGKAIAAVDGSKPILALYTKARPTYTVDTQAAFIAKVRTGAAVAVGDLITANADSKGVSATTGDYALGVALEAATGADEFVKVLVSQQISA
jgi:ABC-type sugar transport system substrate-binding protein